MRKSFMLLAVLLTLSACVSFPKADPNQLRCVRPPGYDAAAAKAREDGVGVVWFTDDGEFVDRCAVSDLFRELRATTGPQIVVLYIHGWKHNGEDGDSDLTHFRSQIAEIRKAEAKQTAPRHVAGIYVAWNGKQTDLRLMKELTFWSRKRAADKVSQSAAVTRLLAAVESIRSKRDQERDSTVYVGHSFGARILYNAVAQVLIRDTERAHPGIEDKPYAPIRGIADIVVLLNPAFEASLFTVFNGVRRVEYPFPKDQPPLLVSISSETDKATRLAFPLGQTLSGNRAPKRRVTLGNYADYWTHRVTSRATAPAAADSGDEVCSPEVCMVRVATNNLPHVPFISASADPAVMDGHNDIWNDKVKEFLAHLIARNNEAVERMKAATVAAGTSGR